MRAPTRRGRAPAREHPPRGDRGLRPPRVRRAHPAALAVRGRADRGGAGQGAARCPLQHPRHREGARQRARPAGGGCVLHRHQPARPRRRRRAWRRRLQRAVLQHAQRRGARDRRDHRAGPTAAREDGEDARRGLGQVRAGQPRGARTHHRHRRLRQHRHAARQRRRGARLPGDLLRHRRPARPRQRTPRRHHRRAARADTSRWRTTGSSSTSSRTASTTTAPGCGWTTPRPHRPTWRPR